MSPTFSDLLEAQQRVKALMDDTPSTILLTPFLNAVDGYWHVTYERKQYIFMGRVQWARLVDELQPLLIQQPHDGYGFATLYGMPVREDDELVKKILFVLIANLQQKHQA